MKAQASVEMLSIYAALLAVFLMSFAVISGQIPTIANLKNSLEAFDTASSLGSAINSVFLSGEGTATTIDIGFENASVQIDGRMLDVRVGSAFYDWPLLTPSTNSSNISSGSVSIRNENGVISIANA